MKSWAKQKVGKWKKKKWLISSWIGNCFQIASFLYLSSSILIFPFALFISFQPDGRRRRRTKNAISNWLHYSFASLASFSSNFANQTNDWSSDLIEKALLVSIALSNWLLPSQGPATTWLQQPKIPQTSAQLCCALLSWAELPAQGRWYHCKARSKYSSSVGLKK